MNNLATVLRDQGKYGEAEQMHGEVVKVSERVLGKEHPSTLTSMNNLAAVLSDQCQHEEAEKIQAVVVVGMLRNFGLLGIWEYQGMEESAREKSLLELVENGASRTSYRHSELEETSGNTLADGEASEC
ncbi:hypothetical protein LTR96_011678 [Exophiala xenobiotica]|nr:hypothetical protein LTR96_011678 [Exophiala xenobiotica]KAK5332184.1 hypothetical protein LTR98_011674 [Exophiala xenobiotica]KAK5357568.1 hypothetical protein LTS13_011152 [Exophiala xenobiotica]KAK5404829.1 hypothetical protein LTR90_011171 [Exophiala xenobiotica]KAK5430745.1 hypothetical protein LTR18_011459 [Exophiala xenobiotica]